MKKIMVVDDDEAVLANVADVLEQDGFIAARFSCASSAIDALSAVPDVDLVLTDLNMPQVSGADLLKASLNRTTGKPVPVIVFTGFGDIDTAVKVMRAGASDFLCKPISGKELLIRVRNVLEKHDLAEEVESLRKRLEDAETFHSFVGKSKKMLEVYDLIQTVACTDMTVLIRGETGTGKELAARAIHAASQRKNEPFVAISCTALQHTLLESELFGHEKGAFTGANSVKIGKLESAGAGTVFLDEIGDTSPEIQKKLLRVLQEMEFERVGGLRPIKLGARIIAATNRDLESAVKEGKFREDLYYRINVVELGMPALREREDDIITLSGYFLEQFKKRYNKTLEGFAPSAIEQILSYSWPGNVRELKNAIERTALITPRKWIDRLTGLTFAKGAQLNLFGDMPARMPYSAAKVNFSSEIDKAYIMHYMKQEKGQINKVAELLGVSARTVSRCLERYGLDKTVFKA